MHHARTVVFAAVALVGCLAPLAALLGTLAPLAAAQLPAEAPESATAAAHEPSVLADAVRDATRSFRDLDAAEAAGYGLLHALRRDPAFAWRDDGAALTWLLGTPRLGAALRRGLGVDEIVALDAADHAAWRERREPYLLYP